jgi:hypothetical protein
VRRGAVRFKLFAETGSGPPLDVMVCDVAEVKLMDRELA